MEFVDCNLCIGLPAAAVTYKPCATADELMAEVLPCGITGGVAWHIAQRDYDPAEGNRLLSEAISGREDLYGCWTILPPQTGEVITPGFFQAMKEHRVTALRAFADLHRYQLRKTVFGGFLHELVRRRVPLMLSVEMGTQWPAIYTLLEDAPELTLIITDIGVTGVSRLTWPLLEDYSNVYLESSQLSLDEGALESTVRKYGAERVIFGSGFPAKYVESAVMGVLHADLPEDDKRKIASGNLRRLMSEVRW